MVREFMGQQRTEKMLALGEANLEVLRQIGRWCKLLKAEQTSSGMLAAVSGLPIGSFRLSCPHATYIPDAMNLPWVSRDYLDHNCRNCSHRQPNGDPKWGQDVLLQIDTTRAEVTRREAEVRSALEELRKQCRTQAEKGRTDNNLTEHQILSWTEQLFDNDGARSEEACKHLCDAVPVASDLFGTAVVEALCVGASTEGFHGVTLRVLAELAGKRTELAETLTDVALAALHAEFG
jgi:hypothetical protein